MPPDRLRKYRPPELARYGSVRNLTGGSGTNGRDGAAVRSRFTAPGQS